MAELYVGLVHYPIYNKRMDVIASAVPILIFMILPAPVAPTM